MRLSGLLCAAACILVRVAAFGRCGRVGDLGGLAAAGAESVVDALIGAAGASAADEAALAQEVFHSGRADEGSPPAPPRRKVTPDKKTRGNLHFLLRQHQSCC